MCVCQITDKQNKEVCVKYYVADKQIRRCTEKNDLAELLRLLHCVKEKWKSIATQLGLSQHVIRDIASKSNDPVHCLRDFLMHWMSQNDSIPTREQLAKALLYPPVREKDIAEKVSPDPLAEQVSPDPISNQVSPNPSLRIQKCQILFVVINMIALFLVFRIMLTPGTSMSLPSTTIKQKLIGGEENLKVINDFTNSNKDDILILFGRGGIGKSKTVIHVGHEMEKKYNVTVYYIDVKGLNDVLELVKYFSTQYRLLDWPARLIGINMYNPNIMVSWAQHLTNKNLLILDNVDGQYWFKESSRSQLKELFINPLLDNTTPDVLQVLITSQHSMLTKHSGRPRSLASLSEKDCVKLMEDNNSEINTDTANLELICKLVENVPFIVTVLAKSFSYTSATQMIEKLEGESMLNFTVDMDNKNSLVSTIDLGFQFVTSKCQSRAFLLAELPQPFTRDEVSRYIPLGVDCLAELGQKSFISYKPSEENYYFYKLHRNYLKYDYKRHHDSVTIDILDLISLCTCT